PTSMPWALATRAATGVAPLASVGALPAPAAGSVAVTSAAGDTGPAAGAGAPGVALMRQRMLPTGTVSSTWTRISAIVPATGHGISASTLSAEIAHHRASTA